jgi:hypothetical protein
MKIISLDRLKWVETISSYLNRDGSEWTEQAFSNCLLVIYSTYNEHRFEDSGSVFFNRRGFTLSKVNVLEI